MTILQGEQAKFTARRQEAFEAFLALPATQLMLSLIPSSEHEDAMKTLLQSTFNAGHGAGICEVVLELLRNNRQP